jgi:hypothetical protein
MKITLAVTATLALGIALNATPAEHSKRVFEKYVNKDLRMQILTECLEAKRKGCHYHSFEKSIQLREVY